MSDRDRQTSSEVYSDDENLLGQATVEEEEKYGMKEHYCRAVMELLQVLKDDINKARLEAVDPLEDMMKKSIMRKEEVEQILERIGPRNKQLPGMGPMNKLRDAADGLLGHWESFINDFLRMGLENIYWHIERATEKIMKMEEFVAYCS